VGADWSVSYSGLLAVPASDNVFQWSSVLFLINESVCIPK
jgi:hypothetical protein